MKASELKAGDLAEQIHKWISDQSYQGQCLLHSAVVCDFVGSRRFIDSLAEFIRGFIADPHPPQGPVKVREGKWYKRRDGEIGESERRTNPDFCVENYPWRVGGRIYRDDGCCFGDSNYDLIAELPEPAKEVRLQWRTQPMLCTSAEKCISLVPDQPNPTAERE